ncbi:hypothetical protein BKA61DRAFT_2798 [Leptodontidium sp. MPI-SDFR-AT-0119]|nr:hypothetical protein BKA61DRAFT_2798 [Leptodontidium sp. MPI-SDFR-AT-0119]
METFIIVLLALTGILSRRPVDETDEGDLLKPSGILIRNTLPPYLPTFRESQHLSRYPPISIARRHICFPSHSILAGTKTTVCYYQPKEFGDQTGRDISTYARRSCSRCGFWNEYLARPCSETAIYLTSTQERDTNDLYGPQSLIKTTGK